MDLNLEGKRALVCGSSQGIGRATAIELAKLGCHLTLLARNEESLREVLRELPTSAQANYIVCDVTQKDLLKEKIDTLLDTQGPISILINNSGGPPGGAITTATAEDFSNALEQHLFTNLLLTQRILPGMQAQQWGRIVNIISTSVKAPLAGLGVSNTTRGAVASWAKTLANEVARYGITVNNVLPGATQTQRLAAILENKATKQQGTVASVTAEMLAEIPAGRFGQAEEVAALIAFLCTNAAAYINGVAIPVDGGRTSCF